MTEKPFLRVVAGVAFRGGRILVTRRPPGAPYAGLWEFPGGKVEPGESDREALVREFREELEIEPRVGEEIATGRHEYPEKTVELHFYRVDALSGDPRPTGVAEIRWIDPERPGNLDFLAGDRELLDRLREPDWRERAFR
ncbi:MAG: (deoxy)nucleoside triphosphate pyrophosphohydrolase [Candidatus Eisenbacteria bacterium]|nr:(deoxy)nucleoside triphosphate pyrophosphohydrolase [Candidatus Eisenbacteria bacterium]